MISEQLLLEGAWYSFEQCGILLRDAVALYERGSHSTAVGLALLAREEMGKARILLDLWRDVVNRGRKVSAAEVRRKLDDHEEKQRKGQISAVVRVESPEVVKLLRASYGPARPERDTAREKLDQLTERLRKRTPTDRHGARMRALYVDLNDSGHGWNRPVEMPGDPRAHLDHAASDYANQWLRYQRPEVLAHDEPKLAAALELWPERPAWPEPAALKFP